MIAKLEIAGVHMTLGDDLKAYVLKKIGALDKYIPQHARKSVHAEVKIKEVKLKARVEHNCEVIMYVPNETLTVNETADTAFAATDAVEDTLKKLLHKYKDTHASSKLKQHMLGRLRRNGDTPEQS